MLTTQHSSSQWLLLFVLLSLVLFGYKKRLLFSSFSNNSPLSLSPLTMLTVLCRRKLFMGKKKKKSDRPISLSGHCEVSQTQNWSSSTIKHYMGLHQLSVLMPISIPDGLSLQS